MAEERRGTRKKPFEGCLRLKDGRFTDDGFWDEELTNADDERFSRAILQARMPLRREK